MKVTPYLNKEGTKYAVLCYQGNWDPDMPLNGFASYLPSMACDKAVFDILKKYEFITEDDKIMTAYECVKDGGCTAADFTERRHNAILDILELYPKFKEAIMFDNEDSESQVLESLMLPVLQIVWINKGEPFYVDQFDEHEYIRTYNHIFTYYCDDAVENVDLNELYKKYKETHK